MKMYVANCTRQVCDFQYRVDKSKGVRQQKIQPGQQIPLADGFLTDAQIKYILEQHERYGLVVAEEAHKTRGVVPRLYSIDKPVSMKIIDETMRRNNGVLIVRGREIRKLAAVQANNVIEQHLEDIANQSAGVVQPTLKELDITIDQINDPKAPFTPSDESDALYNEGIKITKDAGPEPQESNRKSKTGRRAGRMAA